MHHTIDKIPDENRKKYIWEKEHLENKTGTKDKYNPVKLKKMINLKNMKLGNKFLIILIIF